MPLNTQQFDLDAEVERLTEQREELAQKLAEIDEDNPVYEQTAQEGQEVDARLRGVLWARDEAHDADGVAEWDEPADTITLAGLTGGEYGQLEDRIRSASAGGDVAPGTGAARVYLVAEGTVDAPYLSDELSSEERVEITGRLPMPYLKWAEAQINDLMTLGGGEGNELTSFGDLLAEKQAERMSSRD
jgi:hypothetical protein